MTKVYLKFVSETVLIRHETSSYAAYINNKRGSLLSVLFKPRYGIIKIKHSFDNSLIDKVKQTSSNRVHTKTQKMFY